MYFFVVVVVVFRVVFQIYRIKESEIVYSFAVYFKCSLSRVLFLFYVQVFALPIIRISVGIMFLEKK